MDVNNLKTEFRAATLALKRQSKIMDDMLKAIPDDMKDWRDKFTKHKMKLNKALASSDEAKAWEVIQDVTQLMVQYGNSVST